MREQRRYSAPHDRAAVEFAFAGLFSSAGDAAIEAPSSLRSIVLHPGLPFGIIPESAFGFAKST